MHPKELIVKAKKLRARAQAILEELKSEAAEKLSEEEIDGKVATATAHLEEAKKLEARADQLLGIEEDLSAPDEEDDTATRTSRGPAAELEDPEASDGTGRRFARSVPATARDRDEEARCGFHDFGDFAMSVYRSSPAAGRVFRIDPRLTPLYNEDLGEGIVNHQQMERSARSVGRPMAAATGLSQGVGADGGWLIPPAFSQRIWDGMANEVDNLLGLTDQFPLDGAESIEIPANAETSRVTGSRYGGIRGYWIAEADQITASKPKVRKVKLEPHELAVLCYVTDRLLAAGESAVSSWIERAATQELLWLIGDSILNGDGAGKPLGILNSGAPVTVSKESGQAADTFLQANVAKMWARMHARSRRNARWLINQDVDPQLLLMVTEVKNVAGSENVGGFNASLYNVDRDTLMGRPVIRTEWNKTLGDKGDVILADLQAYATSFFRAGVSSAMSMHLRFDFLETAFRFVSSVDGQPWNAAPLTPANGSNTLSPFVLLADRA